MHLHLEGTDGDEVRFDGRMVAQATELQPRGVDSLVVARVFATVGGQWVLQVVYRTWLRGDASRTVAYPCATLPALRAEANRRLASWPGLQGVLWQRLLQASIRIELPTQQA